MSKPDKHEMNNIRRVTVKFSHGNKELIPESWEIEDGRPPRPIFDVPGYSIIETVDGHYIAVEVEK